MYRTFEARLALANRIYDLDAEIYHILGSGLGRVFNGSREKTTHDLAVLMAAPGKIHYLRSQIALIGNMAKTLPNREDKTRIMAEYEAILKDVESLPLFFGGGDILGEDIARMNKMNLSGRFGDVDHLIICISRTYGCAGTDIGFALAAKLGINYYDNEIFTEVMERLEAGPDEFKDRSSFTSHKNLQQNVGSVEKRSFKQKLKEFSRYHGLPKGDAIFFNQTDLLCDMAKREDFIIMGRCGDVILTNHRIPHISIFINAPFEMRVRRVMKTDDLSYKAAVKLLKKLDKQHRRYNEFYTGYEWGNAVNYDLCINSAAYGIEGSVELIERIIKQHTQRSE